LENCFEKLLIQKFVEVFQIVIFPGFCYFIIVVMKIEKEEFNAWLIYVIVSFILLFIGFGLDLWYRKK